MKSITRWFLRLAWGLGLGYLVLSMGIRVLSVRPDGLGVTAGKLAVCPDSPNCVSSQSTDEDHRVAPIAFTGDAKTAFERLKKIVRALPRCTVVKNEDRYVHAEVRSFLFRFVDDLELHLDSAAGVIHLRSASRLGHSDLGVNRKRVETIRNLFAKE